METDKIELKSLMEASEVADYLTALAAGFRAGRIVVEKDGECLVISPAAASKAEVEIEARMKKDKAKFSLELSWRLSEELAPGSELKISTVLPKPAPEADKKADKKTEDKKTEDKKPEADKAEAPKSATQAAAAADKPAAAPAKSDVKPTAPAANEPGVRVVAAAGAQGKPKA